jgi:hypothetical protein
VSILIVTEQVGSGVQDVGEKVTLIPDGKPEAEKITGLEMGERLLKRLLIVRRAEAELP